MVAKKLLFCPSASRPTIVICTTKIQMKCFFIARLVGLISTKKRNDSLTTVYAFGLYIVLYFNFNKQLNFNIVVLVQGCLSQIITFTQYLKVA